MRIDQKENGANFILSENEFNTILIMTGNYEEYKKSHDITEHMLNDIGQALIHVSSMMIPNMYENAEGFYIKYYTCEDSNVIIEITTNNDDTEDTDMPIPYQKPLNSYPQDLNCIHDCKKCFNEDKLRQIINTIKSMAPNPDEKIISMFLEHSDCFNNFIASMSDGKINKTTIKGISDWVTNTIKDEMTKMPTGCMFHKINKLDDILEIIPDIERGIFLERKDGYHLITNRNPLKLKDYGTEEHPFIYDENQILWGIKNGKVVHNTDDISKMFLNAVMAIDR